MIEPIAYLGLVAIGSLLTLVALLSLAWSRISGFRVSIGGVRFEDRGERLPLDTRPFGSMPASATREPDFYEMAKERGGE